MLGHHQSLRLSEAHNIAANTLRGVSYVCHVQVTSLLPFLGGLCGVPSGCALGCCAAVAFG